MRIDSISSDQVAAPAASGPKSSGGFNEAMKDALSSVNDLQSGADEITNKIAAGEPVEIHQAVIEMQKASTALQFTVQVRNKILEAYQEIMRMQV